MAVDPGQQGPALTEAKLKEQEEGTIASTANKAGQPSPQDDDEYAKAGYKGVSIKLPVLQQYLRELNSGGNVGTVTAELAAQLYRGHQPGQLPATIQAYYSGPASKKLENSVDIKANVSPTKDRYAHVTSRIQTHLETATTDGLSRVARSSNALNGTKGIRPSLKPLRCQKQSVVKQAAAAKTVAIAAAGTGKASLCASSVCSDADSRCTSQLISRRSHRTSNCGSTAISCGSNGTLCPASRFVSDVSRLMQRVKAGQAAIEKFRVYLSGGKQMPGMLPAYESSINRLPAQKRGVARQNKTDDNYVTVYTQAALPPLPVQQVKGMNKGSGTIPIKDKLQLPTVAQSDMRKILDQLPYFQGQDDALVDAIADCMTLYSYAPNTLMFGRGNVCNEFVVLLSGQITLHPKDSPVQRLSPGAVVGLELMAARRRVPCDIHADPNFEAVVACMSWEQYEACLTNFAADKVLHLLPGLQSTSEARLRNAVSKHAVHGHCQPGQAIHEQLDIADNLVLLVKGQVLVTQSAEEDVLLSEGQIAQQLQHSIGSTDAIVPNEIPQLPIALGGPAKRESLSGLPRLRVSMAGSIPATLPSITTVPSKHIAPPTTTDAPPHAADSGNVEASCKSADNQGTSVCPKGESSTDMKPHHNINNELEHRQQTTLTLVPPDDENWAQGDANAVETPVLGLRTQHVQAPEMEVEGDASASDGLPAANHPLSLSGIPQASLAEFGESRQSRPELELQPAESGFEFGGIREGGVRTPSPNHGADPDDTDGIISLIDPVCSELGLVSLGDAVDAEESLPMTLPCPHSAFVTAHALKNGEQPVHNATSPIHRRCSSNATSDMYNSTYTTPTITPEPFAKDGLQWSNQAANGQQPNTIDPRQGGTLSSGGAAQHSLFAEAKPRHSLTKKISGSLPVINSERQLLRRSISPQSSQASARASKRVSMVGSMSAPQATVAVSPQNSSSGGAQQSGQSRSVSCNGSGQCNQSLLPETELPTIPKKQPGRLSVAGSAAAGQQQDNTNNDSDIHSQAPMIETVRQSGNAANTIRQSRLAVSNKPGKNKQKQPQLQTDKENAVQKIPVTMPVLQGMPLNNALAAAIKSNKQQVVAAYNKPVFVGSECLSDTAGGKFQYTIIAFQPCEYISISREVLVSHLANEYHDTLQRNINAEHVHKLSTGSTTQVLKQWPETAATMRQYLATAPGSRPAWQVETLADAFSGIETIAALPWQARLRLFQELQLKQLTFDTPGIQLSHTIYTVDAMSAGDMGSNSQDEICNDLQLELFEELGSERMTEGTNSNMDTPRLSLPGGYAPFSNQVVTDVSPSGTQHIAMRGNAGGDGSAGNSRQSTPRSPIHHSIAAATNLTTNASVARQTGDDSGHVLSSSSSLARKGILGFTVERRGSTHEVVQLPSEVPQLQLAELPQESYHTQGASDSDRLSDFGGWQPVKRATSKPPGSRGHTDYDIQPHEHIAALAAGFGSLKQHESLQQPGVVTYVGDVENQKVNEPVILQPESNIVHNNTEGVPSSPSQKWKPCSIRGINLKTDDSVYIVVSGVVQLKAVLQPSNVTGATAAIKRAQRAAKSVTKQLDWVDPLLPVTLRQLLCGQSFNASDAMDSATLQPPGSLTAYATRREAEVAEAAIGKHPGAVPAIAGTRQILACAHGPQPAEVLCMGLPLYTLSSHGSSRAAKLDEAVTCFKHCSWAPALWEHYRPPCESRQGSRVGSPACDPETSVKKLLGSCRVEEYKKGTELLRRGEAAPAVYFVLEGACVLNACHVGLAENASASAPVHELTRLQAGQSGSCGELSLLSSRRLWCSLVVASATAKVMFVDVAALKEFLMTHVTPEGVSRLLQCIASADVELYGTALHMQARKLAAGDLQLHLFTPATRKLLLQILELGELDLSDVKGAAQLDHQAAHKSSHSGEPNDGGVLPAGPVIIEGTDKADSLVDGLARPTHLKPSIHELASVRRVQDSTQRTNALLSNLDNGSHISSVGIESADSSQRHSINSTRAAIAGVKAQAELLRVAVPTMSMEEPFILKPVELRQAHIFDRRRVPKVLQGSEIEASRLPNEDMLSMSVVKAQEVIDMVQVKVHRKATGSQLLPDIHLHTIEAPTAMIPQQEEHVHLLPIEMSTNVQDQYRSGITSASWQGPMSAALQALRGQSHSSLSLDATASSNDAVCQQASVETERSASAPRLQRPRSAWLQRPGSAWQQRPTTSVHPTPVIHSRSVQHPQIAPLNLSPGHRAKAFHKHIHHAGAATVRIRARAVTRDLSGAQWHSRLDALNSARSRRQSLFGTPRQLPVVTALQEGEATRQPRLTFSGVDAPSQQQDNGSLHPISSSKRASQDKVLSALERAAETTQSCIMEAVSDYSTHSLVCMSDIHGHKEKLELLEQCQSQILHPNPHLVTQKELHAAPTVQPSAVDVSTPLAVSVQPQQLIRSPALNAENSMGPDDFQGIPAYIVQAIQADADQQKQRMRAPPYPATTYGLGSTCTGSAADKTPGFADQRHIDTNSNTSSEEVTGNEGPAQQVVCQRSLWVRNAFHDPTGITDDLMSDLLAQAVNQPLLAATEKTCHLPTRHASELPNMKEAGVGIEELGQLVKQPVFRIAASLVKQKAIGGLYRAAQNGQTTMRKTSRASDRNNTSHERKDACSTTTSTQQSHEARLMTSCQSEADDSAYVTLGVPQPVKVTPDMTLLKGSMFGKQDSPPIAHVNAQPMPGQHKVATKGYVPATMRKVRDNAVLGIDTSPAKHQWIVPAFNSKAGFQAGMYDEDAEIMYYD